MRGPGRVLGSRRSGTRDRGGVREIDPPSLAGLILFCSSRYDLDRLAEAIAVRSEGLVVIGWTSSGEIAPDGLCEGSITAIGFGGGFHHVPRPLRGA